MHQLNPFSSKNHPWFKKDPNNNSNNFITSSIRKKKTYHCKSNTFVAPLRISKSKNYG